MNIRWNWGTAIALVYCTFAGGTITMVVIAARSPVDVVSDDYYARAIVYDSHRDAVQNGLTPGASPEVAMVASEHAIVISWPGEAATPRAALSGTLTLYRPSNAAADRVVPVALDEAGRQRVPLSGLTPGHWTAQLAWITGGRSFYLERPVIIP